MLVKYGGGILDARGSIGGQTHSRNKSGAYVRARTTPINPRSARQTAIRAKISYVAQLYRSGLSAAQKAAWAVFAANVPKTNKLGEVINHSGYNCFVSSNVASLNAGLTTILPAPTVFTMPGADPDFESTIDAGTGKLSLTFDADRDWCDEDGGALIVEMGLPQSDSIGFFNGPWRHAGVVEGDSATAPTSPDANLDVPFEVADGQKVWTRAKILRADGRLSNWFRDETIVATA